MVINLKLPIYPCRMQRDHYQIFIDLLDWLDACFKFVLTRNEIIVNRTADPVCPIPKKVSLFVLWTCLFPQITTAYFWRNWYSFGWDFRNESSETQYKAR